MARAVLVAVVALGLFADSCNGKRVAEIAWAGAALGAEGPPDEEGATVVLWFRNDLRLRDNPLFHHGAIKRAASVLPVYCFDPRHFGSFGALHPRWSQGAGAFNKTSVLRARFLVESVAAMQASLRELGLDLIVAHGRPEEVLAELAFRAGGRVHVLAQREVAEEEAAVESAVRSAFEARGLNASLKTVWGAQTLYAPEDLPFQIGRLPEPFTLFRNAVESEKKPVRVRPELLAPKALPPLRKISAGFAQTVDVGSADAVLRRLGFPPEEVGRAIDERCANNFVGGEDRALERLEQFVRRGLATYKQTRDGFLGSDFSSKLSPWIAVGCVSPRTVYWRVAKYEDQHGETLDTYWLTFELKWRDFFRFFGKKHGKNIFLVAGPAHKRLTWSNNDEAFERWRLGQTGVPFVDANMRELLLTGFMSNRGRQCVASFLTQDLKLDWRLGAQWFEHTLLDHDVASNYGNWAFAAGVGMRGQRTNKFNVAKQAQQYDKQAKYIKLWVPEVVQLQPKHAISPWELSEEKRRHAGIPDSYPAGRPVVRPSFSEGARKKNDQRMKSQGAKTTKSGFAMAKRRIHRGRKSSYMAS